MHQLHSYTTKLKIIRENIRKTTTTTKVIKEKAFYFYSTPFKSYNFFKICVFFQTAL